MRRVAVTGMGIISPVGNDLGSFWDGVVNARNGIDFITRFDTSDMKVKIAAEVKGFEPEKYMDKGTARKSDLVTQYALAAASQAMEDSAIEGTVPSGRLGVYIGSGIGGMNTFVSELLKMEKGGPRKVSPFFIPMMIVNMVSGAVAIKYGAMGPSLPVVTACATSTNALGEAFRAIAHGYADAIISGGSEASVNPLAFAGFTNCMALSTKNIPDESSLPFDSRRDGFVMGEGAAVLVLEEYERAQKRGAKIYAELCGYGNTCDAHHMTAPLPDARGAAEAIRLAVSGAGIKEGDGVYINAHGTGTPLNDKAETAAIKMAFPERTGELLISSTKAVTGHMLGATGAAEAIACVMALKEQLVPPTANLHSPDPECDLDYVPLTARSFTADFAVSNSFGFGGHNASIVFKRA